MCVGVWLALFHILSLTARNDMDDYINSDVIFLSAAITSGLNLNILCSIGLKPSNQDLIKAVYPIVVLTVYK